MKPLLACRGIHYFATRFGWMSLRASAFDAKYRGGMWKDADDRFMDEFVRRHLGQSADLLMMGCGGATGIAAMEQDGCIRTATGIDLSDEALARARSTVVSPLIDFLKADMTTYRPSRKFDVILFIESIYYVPRRDRIRFLRDLTRDLKPNGVIIATFAHPEQWVGILNEIRQEFLVIEDVQLGGGKRKALVFRARPEDVNAGNEDR